MNTAEIARERKAAALKVSFFFTESMATDKDIMSNVNVTAYFTDI